MNKSEKEKLASYVDTLMHDFNSTPEMISVGETLLCMFPTIKDTVMSYKGITDIINLQKCIVGAIKDASLSMTISSSLDKNIFKIITDNSDTFYDIVSDYTEDTGCDPVVLAESMVNAGQHTYQCMKTIVTSEEWLECCEWNLSSDTDAYRFITGGFINTQN